MHSSCAEGVSNSAIGPFCKERPPSIVIFHLLPLQKQWQYANYLHSQQAITERCGIRLARPCTVLDCSGLCALPECSRSSRQRTFESKASLAQEGLRSHQAGVTALQLESDVAIAHSSVKSYLRCQFPCIGMTGAILKRCVFNLVSICYHGEHPLTPLRKALNLTIHAVN